MIRGISFEIPNERSTVLFKILENINVNKYYWSIEEKEVFEDVNSYFDKEGYSGKIFYKIINIPCYAVFLNLRAYYKKKSNEVINNYYDFIKSKCELVVLISDNIYVEIYSKNRDEIDTIKRNAEKNKFINIEYITDENDIRTVFYVLDKI